MRLRTRHLATLWSATAVALMLAACGSASSPSVALYRQAAGAGRSWNGFGATLAAFRSAHPGCPAANTQYGYCAGPVIMTPKAQENPSSHQFYGLDVVGASTSGGTGGPRILGLGEALPARTTRQEAMRAIDRLFPADVTVAQPVTILRRGGASCAVYELRSRALGRLLAAYGDPQGIVQVGLDSRPNAPLPDWNPASVENALMSTALSPLGDVQCPT